MKAQIKKAITLILCIIISFCTNILVSAGNTSDASENSFLFIGNSMTYFNCLPNMFYQMAAAGGYDVDYISCTYDGRTIAEHANAIQGIKNIETSGNKHNAISQYDDGRYSTGESDSFNQSVYDYYKEIFWDENEKTIKKYDYVVLQLYHDFGEGDVLVSSTQKAIENIIDIMNNPDCTYIINVTWPVCYGDDSLGLGTIDSGYKESQNSMDAVADECVNNILAAGKLAGKCKNITVAYTGRAMTNYLYYYGEFYANSIEPEAYQIYQQMHFYSPVTNDLIIADQIHPTQLGSYIEAACIYSAVFGDATSTTYGYHGGSDDYSYVINGFGDGMNYGIVYNGGMGFSSNDICYAATNIAAETQLNGLNLCSRNSSDHILVLSGDMWAAEKNGVVDTSFTGLVENEYGWWYVTNGYLDWNYTGYAANKYGIWYVENGYVDLSFTGIVKNGQEYWYISNGYLDADYNGSLTYNNAVWTISDGIATKQY